MRVSGKLAVVLGLVVALAACEALARGPHGGGPAGGPSGFARPGNHPGGPAPVVHPNNHPGGPAWHGPGTWQPSSQNWQRQLQAVTPSHWQQWQRQASQIRSGVENRYDHLFTPQWYATHPYVWQVTHPHVDAWAAVTWGTLNGWLGASSYGYGGATVYQENTYLVNGADTAGTNANPNASEPTSPETPAPTSGQWLPLGVFTLVSSGQTASDRVLQLAVAQNGTIGGTYFDALTNRDLPVQGSVDRQSQRVTWTVGSNPQTVMETSLENLTKNEAPVWVHFGPDQTQNWLMVRVRPQGTAPGTTTGATPGTTGGVPNSTTNTTTGTTAGTTMGSTTGTLPTH